MRLTILGTSTPYPRPGNACSGYLVQSARTSIWVDAGTGTLSELQRHIDLATLDAIWISHSHADHTADLLTAYYALRFADVVRAEPLPLVGPGALLERMAAFLGPASVNKLPEVFKFTEMKRAGGRTIGDLSLHWQPVEHGVPAFGLRIESPAAKLAYSGDSAKCDAILDLARGATAFLCETGVSHYRRGEDRVHCTPEDAGEIAHSAGAERLIVTHIGGGMSGEQAAFRAQTAYAGPIDIARPGHIFDLGMNDHLF
jgi:ribonuclease BN (tRNA processing enzyme)